MTTPTKRKHRTAANHKAALTSIIKSADLALQTARGAARYDLLNIQTIARNAI